MSVASVASLLDVLRQYRLLDSAQLQDLAAAPSRFADPKSLARELLQRGWLTPYQANHLLQGRGQELILGQYILMERLGEGGMGQVFKARHRNLGRVVAVKLIRKERLQSDDAVKRFQREVRAVAALTHPNIVRAEDADSIGGTHLLVMECIDGALDLARLVAKSGPVPAAQACAYIRQAALGLQHAYERGLVHRDIKPHNLLLTGDRTTVKVLDMGLARLAQSVDDDASEMTREGAVMGTPDYIAPEQAADSHSADIRSDIYSLGCTFYQLLSGRVPYPGGTLVQKLLKHRLEEPRPLEELCPDLPPGVAGVVRTMMAKQPADRYQTPAAVVEAIDAVLASDGAIVAGPPPVSLPAGSADTFDTAFAALGSADTAENSAVPRRTPPAAPPAPLWLWIGGACSLVISAAVALLLFSRWHSTPEKPAPDEPQPAKARSGPDKAKEPADVLDGKWYYAGPFDNTGAKAVTTSYAPEREIKLDAVYLGKGQQQVRWREYPGFVTAAKNDFMLLFKTAAEKQWACIYLYHEIDSPQADDLPVFLGSDDTLTLWLNGERLLHRNVYRALAPDQEFALLKLKAGKNQLLIKVCQGMGDWGFYIAKRNPWFYELPEFEPWVKEVAALPAGKQVEAVRAKLTECNFFFDGKFKHTITGNVVTSLEIASDVMTDLSPVRGLTKLKKLVCIGTSSGRGLLCNLAPLRGLELEHLNCGYNPGIWDLSPLANMPLAELLIGGTKAGDLSVLKGMPLKKLWAHDVPFTNTGPLGSLKLEIVNFKNTGFSETTLLKNMPLKEVTCDFKPFRDGEVLRSCRSLSRINGKVATVFWQEVDAVQAELEKWCKDLAALPVDEQLAAFSVKMKELNPSFDGKLVPTTEGGVVTGLNLVSDRIVDLAPVRAFPALTVLECVPSSSGARSKLEDLSPLRGLPLCRLKCGRSSVADLRPLAAMPLQYLECAYSKVTDLSPLKGGPLEELACDGTEVTSLAPLAGLPLKKFHCAATKVSDLSPLRGMPLSVLDCSQTAVADLAPLKELPLKELKCDFEAARDATLLRSITSLAKINAKAAATFWKEVDSAKKK